MLRPTSPALSCKAAGSNTHTHDLPAHTHVPDDAHSHELPYANGTTTIRMTGGGNEFGDGSVGTFTRKFSRADDTTDNMAHALSDVNTPPETGGAVDGEETVPAGTAIPTFFALAFIMKAAA